jgi:hypothetical protein
VYGVACARISTDADPDEDYLPVGMLLGGHTVDQALIGTGGLLKLPSLTLEAQVNGPGATPDQFSFDVSPAINGQTHFTIPSTKDKIKITNVPPETSYTVTETGPSGFAFTSGTGTRCTFNGSTATATPGPSTGTALDAACTFVNGQAQTSQATLKVVKVVVNDNGGTKTVSDFPLYVNGNSVVSGATNPLAAGTYTVTEDTTSDYAGTFSGDCDANGNVTLTPGSNKICTLTNDDQIAHLTVNKVVVNDNGGTKTVSDFTLFINNAAVTSSVPVALAPGTYQVSELADHAYAGTFSGDCDATGNVTLALGQNKTCTITNNDVPPTLRVLKQVVNDNGGTKTEGDFQLFVNSSPVTSGAVNTYAVGSYNVSEAADTGYMGTFSGDCDINGNVTLALGDTKECVLTNDDKQGTVIVTNTVVNDNNGTKTVDDFPLALDGNQVASGASTPVDAGAHQVTVTNDYNYAVTFGGDCDASGNVNVAPGATANCSVETNDPSALLTIHKVVINDNGGLKTVADFQAYIGATPVDADTPIALAEGRYVVNERADSGYVETYSGDCDASGNITLVAGDIKNCTITSDDAKAGLTVVTRVINDGNGTLLPSNFTTFIQAVGNPTVFQGSADGVTTEIGGGNFSVGQLLQDGYNFPVFEGSCAGFIQPGGALVCTITNDDF